MRTLLAILILASTTHAQDAQPAGEQAFAAFARAREIVFEQGQFRRNLPEVWGVAVTLRQGPRRFTADSMAFDQARVGLIDAVAREIENPTDADAKLTVELAGRPSAINGERGLADVALAIRPGLDAVAVRAGDASAVIFPDAALSGAMLPSEMVVMALREAMDNRLPPGVANEPGAWARYADSAVRQDEATVYRAPVTVLAQPSNASAPVLVHRGGRVIGLNELLTDDLGALTSWAEEMAGHLFRRRHDGLEPYGLRGTLDALSGEHTGPVDQPFNQALAAHVLMRYGTSSWAPEGSADGARIAGLVLLRQLALVTPVRIGAMEDLGDEAPLEPEPWADVASAAMVLIAMDALEDQAFEDYPELAAMRERCAAVVRGAVGLSITGSAIFTEGTPLTAYALIAYAMVALGDSGIASQEDTQIGRAAARAVVSRVEPEVLVPQMPWLLAALSETEPLTGTDALRQMRRLVWDHQLEGPAVEGDNRDLAGGIVFTRGGVPLPTWQTARAAVAMGAMMLDPRLTPPDQRTGEFIKMLKTLRFLRQLTVDDSLGHLLADPDLASGGVRAALWDQRQPSVATSLTLLAVCDTLDTAYLPRD